jgi:hypothetical protein
VKNEWTKKIGESLARYRPKEYPVLKDAKSRMVALDTSPARFADTVDGPSRRAIPADPGVEAAAGAPAPAGGDPDSAAPAGPAAAPPAPAQEPAATEAAPEAPPPAKAKPAAKPAAKKKKGA